MEVLSRFHKGRLRQKEVTGGGIGYSPILQSASTVHTFSSAEKLEPVRSHKPEKESCQKGLSARLNAIKRLKVK